MSLETKLAAAHLTRTEQRDPDTVYNKCSPGKLAALCKGGIEWPRFFELVRRVPPSHGPGVLLSASLVWQVGKPAPKSLNVDSPVALATAVRLTKPPAS